MPNPQPHHHDRRQTTNILLQNEVIALRKDVALLRAEIENMKAAYRDQLKKLTEKIAEKSII